MRVVEARRLAESARDAGLGDHPDAAIRGHSRALSLLGDEEETPLHADVLRWQAVVIRDRGQTAEAEPLLRRSLAMAERLGYDAGICHAMNHLSSLALRRGDLEHAAAMMADALGVADRCGETRLVGMLQQNLGIVADIRGNSTAAFAHYRRGLRTFEQSHDQQQMCGVLNNLGCLHTKQGEFDAANAVFDQALAIARTGNDLLSEGTIEENRAELWLIVDDVQLAYPSITRALDIAERRNDGLRRAGALKVRGGYERLTNRAATAVDTLRYAASSSALSEDALLGAEIRYQLGHALEANGQRGEALTVWDAALRDFQRIGVQQWMARTRVVLSGTTSGRYW